MPAKAHHQTNPTDMEHWSNLPDHEDFYVVNPGHVVGVIGEARTYKRDGNTIHESRLAEPIHAGSIVPAKSFGPGADLQRHVDNGAIREATPWEVEEVRKSFAPDAGRTTAIEGKATTVEPTKSEAKTESTKPAPGK